MFADFATPAELGFRTFSPKQLMRRLAAAIAAADARARQRQEYKRVMECDEILRDVGITREDIRQAMGEL